MEPDIHVLSKAGISKEQIEEIVRCDDKEVQVLIHNVFNAAAFPFSGALSNGLRAAGDVKFTMYVSVVTTVAVRLFLSYLSGITLQMGVTGIAFAMVCDWVVRAVLFIWRERTGRWKAFQVIK